MAAKKPQPADLIRTNLRKAAEASGLTQEEIGLRMGFSKSGARQAVSRLLGRANYDPRLSTLISFALAVNRPLKEFLP
jgi:transcriptional regulator with XRE-family HTH domain